MKKETRRRIMIWIVLAIASIVMILVAAKVLKASFQLFVLNDNIQYYNEQTVKTDKMTAEAEKYYEIRENQMYNSQDVIVRGFANRNSFCKVVFTVFALITLLFTIYFWIVVVVAAIRKTAKKVARKNKYR